MRITESVLNLLIAPIGSLRSALHRYYDTLSQREENLLDFNKMFENDHAQARKHCGGLVVVPFRIIKVILVEVFTAKTAAEEQIEKIIKEQVEEARAQGKGSEHEFKNATYCLKLRPRPHFQYRITQNQAQIVFDKWLKNYGAGEREDRSDR